MTVTPGLISVVIPAYNAVALIGAALDSVAAQTHRQWEVIVVEDGTNDGTEGLLARFAQNHPEQRVVFHRHPANRGPSASRNTAMGLAQGEHIAFLDHDDFWKPEHLANAALALKNDGIDFVFCTLVKFDSESGDTVGEWGPTAEDHVNFFPALYLRNFIAPSAMVMRRKVYETVGNFDEHLRVCEDHDYWLRALENGFRIRHLETRTCWYRANRAAAATADVVRMLEGDLVVLQKHRDFPLVSDTERRKGRAVLYGHLAELTMAQSRKRGLKFLAQAWLEQPQNFLRLRRLVSVMWKGLTKTL